MNAQILAMKPFINEALSSVFEDTVCLASYNKRKDEFFKSITSLNKDQKKELVPTNLMNQKQLHFGNGQPVEVDDIIFTNKTLENRMKNLFRLIEAAFENVIFLYKVNMTFDQFNENESKSLFSFNKPKAMSCRVIFEIHSKFHTYENHLRDKNMNKLVIFFRRIEKDMPVYELNKLMVNMDLMKKEILTIFPDIDNDGLLFDLGQPEENLKKNLAIIDMFRI